VDAVVGYMKEDGCRRIAKEDSCRKKAVGGRLKEEC
jgi:hypothetical protein